MRRRRLGFILLLILPLALAQPSTLLAKGGPQTQPNSPPPVRIPKPVPEIERALLISIDGCRPDLLLQPQFSEGGKELIGRPPAFQQLEHHFSPL